MDDKNLEQLSKENPTIETIKKIFFKNAIPNITTTRSIKIRNKTSVRVKYHWELFKEIQDLP